MKIIDRKKLLKSKLKAVEDILSGEDYFNEVNERRDDEQLFVKHRLIRSILTNPQCLHKYKDGLMELLAVPESTLKKLSNYQVDILSFDEIEATALRLFNPKEVERLKQESKAMFSSGDRDPVK